MTESIRAIRTRDWKVLHDRISKVLDNFGRKDAFGRGDYWLLDEDWGWFVHQVEFSTLEILRPHVILALQQVISSYPDWEIPVRLCIPEKREIWPGMGIIVHSDEIIDELRRDLLPPEFSEMTFARQRKA